VNFTNSSAIYINGREIKEVAENLDIEKLKGEFSITSDVKVRYELIALESFKLR